VPPHANKHASIVEEVALQLAFRAKSTVKLRILLWNHVHSVRQLPAAVMHSKVLVYLRMR